MTMAYVTDTTWIEAPARDIARSAPFVAMYAPSPNGGHAKYCHELLTALSSLDNNAGGVPLDFKLVTSCDLNPRWQSTQYGIVNILPRLKPRVEFGNTVIWAGSRATHYLRRERRFLQWLRSQDDCVGVHFQEYTPWLAPRDFRAIQRMGKAVYMTVHNIRPHLYTPGVPHSVYDNWNRSAWRACTVLFVHSGGLRDELSQFLGTGHPPIVIVPHGVWTQPAQWTSGTHPHANRRKRALFFGQLRSNKGVSVLLDAMQWLSDIDVTIAGDPESPAFREEIRARAANLPDSRVTLVDRFIEEEEIPRFFQDADLMVLPYTSFAAQSGVLHDAIAWELPVVVTDIGALGESVRTWGNGVVVRPGDAPELAGGIRDLLEPETYRRARMATVRLQQELSWERSAEVTLNAYRKGIPIA